MTKTTYNNPYHPYPYEMRGQFAEKQQNDKTRFFELDSIKYDEEKIKSSIEDDSYKYSLSEIYIERLNRPITDSDNVFYLYKIESYYADPNLEKRDLFIDSINSYERYYFQNIDELLALVNYRWGLVLTDFVPIYETHIPQY